MTALCRKRKILQIYYEPFFSGISRHVIYLLKAIENKPYHSWVLCSTGDEKIRNALNISIGSHQVKIVGPGRFLSLSGFLHVIRLIRLNRIEVVHIHNLQTGIWAIPAALLGGCREIIFTPQVDNVGIGFLEPVSRKLFGLLKLFPLKLIAVSREQKEKMVNLGFTKPGKVKYIPNHISNHELDETLQLDPDTIRRKNNLPLNGILVSQVARLDRQKNPQFLIQVAKMTREQVPQVVFLLIGDGPLKKKLAQEINRFDLGSFVKLMGYRHDALALMHASDIMTLTSRWEGLPYALLEAVYLKKPAVVTDVPGNREVIVDGESGFLANTPEQFAARLVELARSKDLRAAMGMSGYIKNKDLFDPGHLADQIRGIYSPLNWQSRNHP